MVPSARVKLLLVSHATQEHMPALTARLTPLIEAPISKCICPLTNPKPASAVSYLPIPAMRLLHTKSYVSKISSMVGYQSMLLSLTAGPERNCFSSISNTASSQSILKFRSLATSTWCEQWFGTCVLQRSRQTKSSKKQRTINPVIFIKGD